jgi:predicted membrane protein
VLYAKDFSFFCANFSFFWLTISVIFAVFLSFSFANRLTNIKENHKFQKDGKEVHVVEDPTLGLRHIVGEIKDKHA